MDRTYANVRHLYTHAKKFASQNSNHEGNHKMKQKCMIILLRFQYINNIFAC